MSALIIAERPADAVADGLLVLHHGRGTSEQDLLPLADVLDPARRFHVVAPRGPLQIRGFPGNHWYAVPRVGYPDPDTFRAAYAALSELHDELFARTGFGADRTVLGGFSMGTVMSYALGLGPDRPAPAGILAFSGFIPTVEGWAPDLTRSDRTRVFIAHGTNDPVIGVEFARLARAALEPAGFTLDYGESDAGHNIDPAGVRRAIAWLDETIRH